MRIRDIVRSIVPPIVWELGNKRVQTQSSQSTPTQSSQSVPKSNPGGNRIDECLGEVVDYRIGQYSIVLPHHHALPKYQANWKLYDKSLPIIAAALRAKYSSFSSIDIGANVGDTAAAISTGHHTPVLCIEGDPSYLPFLRHNASIIGSQIAIEVSYVGDSTRTLQESVLHRSVGGTTSAASVLKLKDSRDHEPEHSGDQPQSDAIRVQRLESILERHPEFSKPRLLKIDTDGFDFRIIASHSEYLRRLRPVLHFEYLVESAAAHEESLSCIQSLVESGYRTFLVFDNFGNLMNAHADHKSFSDINLYLLSHIAFGRAVYYCDVLALSEEDSDIADAVRHEFSRKVMSGIGGVSGPG